MTARIFNMLMGLWLFTSAFVFPQSRGQMTWTAVCGALTVLFAALTSYNRRSRYVTAAIGALVVVLAFAAHPLGSTTFWHNGIMGISIAVGAWADRAPLAERYPRELYGGMRV
jgi:dolichyl-phosphate-mannose--protein O-mannosyl transferase